MDGGTNRSDRGPREQREAPLARRLAVLGRRDVAAGLTFGIAIAVFTLGGYALDRAFGTSPLLVLIGFALGAVGGFVHLVETISPGTLFRSRRKGSRGSPERGDRV